jgi:HEAT repeat protein
MGIGARKAVVFTALIALLAGLVIVPANFATAQEDRAEIDRLFAEAVDLWERGRAEEAAAVLKDLLSRDPSQETAYDLLRKAEYQMFLELLTQGGDSELVAKRLMELARLGEREKSKDEAAIRALVERAIDGADLGVRESARLQLLAHHGQYAVPFLYHYLGSNDTDQRVNAMLALSELGSDAVLPLTQVLHTDNERIQQNAAAVLSKIGDVRALGGLVALSENSENPSVREAAARAAASVAADGAMGGGDLTADGAYLALANRYYSKHASVIRNYNQSYTLWSWSDGSLVDRDVPRMIYHLELARQASYDALAQAADSQDARNMVAAMYYAEKAAFDSLPEDTRSSDEVQALMGSYWNGAAIANAQGVDTQLGVLDLALTWGDSGVARAALVALPAVWDGREVGDSLLGALESNDKTVRFAAANAALSMESGMAFAGSEMVVPIAAQAVALGSVRNALLIEPSAEVRAKSIRALDDASVFAVAEASGAAGFRRAKEVGTFDVVVIRAELPDKLALAIVNELRRDFRTAATPILISGGEQELESAQDLFGTSVQGYIPADPIDVEAVANAAAQSMNDDQTRALSASRAACEALAGIDRSATAFDNYSEAEGSLSGVLSSDKPDEVKLAALNALSSIGSAAAAGALTETFTTSANSMEVRVGAAIALGSVLSGMAAPEASFDALLAGVGDESLEVRAAASSALGRMDLTAEQRNMILTQYRVE